MLAFEPPGLCSPRLTQGRRGMEVKDRCVTPSVACRPVHAGELWLLRMTSVSRQLGARLGWVTGVGQALNAHPGAGPGVSALAHLPSQAPRGAGRPAPTPCVPHPRACAFLVQSGQTGPSGLPLHAPEEWLPSTPAPLTGAMDPCQAHAHPIGVAGGAGAPCSSGSSPCWRVGYGRRCPGRGPSAGKGAPTAGGVEPAAAPQCWPCRYLPNTRKDRKGRRS